MGQLFFHDDPYMKFQDTSMHGSKVTGGTKKCDARMNEQTNERTSQKQYAPPLFVKVGGINMKALSCSQQFFRHSRANNSKVNDRIWPEFKLILHFMPVIVIWKYDGVLIKNKGFILSTFSTLLFYGKFFQLSRASNSASRIWPENKFIQGVMPVLNTCKFEDQIKNEGAIVSQHFP